MTIAACYLTPEGVVLGADSTASYIARDGLHYLNHAQKVYEIGQDSSLGLVGWGLGEIGGKSIRTLVAECADALAANPPTSVQEAADKFKKISWRSFDVVRQQKAAEIDRFLELHTAQVQGEFLSSSKIDEHDRLAIELGELRTGFFIGGWVTGKRQPDAFAINLNVMADDGMIEQLVMGDVSIEGEPEYAHRLFRGIDSRVRDAILTSSHWKGTQDDLDQLLTRYALRSPVPPIRDAIDQVFAAVYTTIKAIKFSDRLQTVGGGIEVAVITTDRPFRWARHKTFESAIKDGEPW